MTANFLFAHFMRTAIFDAAYFADQANFDSAYFGSGAVFKSAQFIGIVGFTNTQFCSLAYFDGTHFAGPALFHGAEFFSGISFSDGSFGGHTSFREANFRGSVPTFFQCEMHQDTGFSEDYRLWPKATDARNASLFKESYTRLRQIASANYNPDLEHFFLRQEMRCKEELAKGFDRWFFRGYRWLSDYGISVARPVVGLIMVVGLSWGVIGSHLKHSSDAVSIAPIVEGLGVSVGNTLPFLGLVRKMHPEFYENAPWWLDALSAVQSVLGIVLLFFLGLGLRNRFRLK